MSRPEPYNRTSYSFEEYSPPANGLKSGNFLDRVVSPFVSVSNFSAFSASYPPLQPATLSPCGVVISIQSFLPCLRPSRCGVLTFCDNPRLPHNIPRFAVSVPSKHNFSPTFALSHLIVGVYRSFVRPRTLIQRDLKKRCSESGSSAKAPGSLPPRDPQPAAAATVAETAATTAPAAARIVIQAMLLMSTATLENVRETENREDAGCWSGLVDLRLRPACIVL